MSKMIRLVGTTVLSGVLSLGGVTAAATGAFADGGQWKDHGSDSRHWQKDNKPHDSNNGWRDREDRWHDWSDGNGWRDDRGNWRSDKDHEGWWKGSDDCRHNKHGWEGKDHRWHDNSERSGRHSHGHN